jgi:hypothetical protein
MSSNSASENADRLFAFVRERPANPELVAQGWERRFVTDGRRLKEYVELYESIGYEVKTEPVQAEEIGPDCLDCRLITLLQFHTLYARKRP